MIRSSVIFNFLPDFTRKGNFAVRPTENNFTKFTPFLVWFCRYLSENDPWLVAVGVLKRNVKVAVCLRS